MILYKFSYCSSDEELIYNVVEEFSKKFEDHWIESPIFQNS